MKEITQRWIVENGEGHWEISSGSVAISCDTNEIKETIDELLKDELVA